MGASPGAFLAAACQEPVDQPLHRRGLYQPRGKDGEWAQHRDAKSEDLLVFGAPSRSKLQTHHRWDDTLAHAQQSPTSTTSAQARGGYGQDLRSQPDYVTVEQRAMPIEEESYQPQVAPLPTPQAPGSPQGMPPGTPEGGRYPSRVQSAVQKGMTMLSPASGHPSDQSPSSQVQQTPKGQVGPMMMQQPMAMPQTPQQYSPGTPGGSRDGLRPGEIEVKLERPTEGKAKVGLHVKPTKDSRLNVTNVTEGLLQEWNRAHRDKEVKVGDSIMAVNYYRGDTPTMLGQIREARTLILYVMPTNAEQ